MVRSKYVYDAPIQNCANNLRIWMQNNGRQSYVFWDINNLVVNFVDLVLKSVTVNASAHKGEVLFDKVLQTMNGNLNQQ